MTFTVHRIIRPTLPLGALVPAVLWLTGCQHPITARKVSAQQSYRESTVSALSQNDYSAETRIVLHRFNLEERFHKEPAETLQWLHEKARTDDRVDLLFALAELSYLHGDNLLRNAPYGANAVPPPAQDYFLCSTLYAHMFLVSHGRERQDLFDPRVRTAVSLYNRSLARGFMRPGDSSGTVDLSSRVRQLPPGPVQVEFSQPGLAWDLSGIDHFVSADDYVVRGLTVRNQQSGLGAPLIGIGTLKGRAQIANRVPAAVYLRVPGDVRQWSAGEAKVGLELYSGYDRPDFAFGGHTLPLRADITTTLAHALNDDSLWGLDRAQFLSSVQKVKTGVYPIQPYVTGRVPVVFVHGTASSPIWWAEMWNTLLADPVLSVRCQFWNYVYNSGNPVPYSAALFREALTDSITRHDPEGKDPALRQMVVIGHSQGGLLTKMAVTNTGDQLWQALTDKPFAEVKLNEEQRRLIQRSYFVEALPFVTRAVFISTPHRGSYRTSSFVRRIASWLVKLPSDVVHLKDTVKRIEKEVTFRIKVEGAPTSLDSMSTRNPVILTLADIPPAPGVTSHSIIAVKGDDPPEEGNDGVVEYKSAHVGYVKSELVVRSGHSCQDKPVTIEEVRRILLEHLASLPPAATTPAGDTGAAPTK